MLTETQAKTKMERLAQSFAKNYEKGKYGAALNEYTRAVNVAVFMEFEQADQEKWFGIRGDRGEEILRGLFPDAIVQKVQEMVTVRGIMDKSELRTKTK